MKSTTPRTPCPFASEDNCPIYNLSMIELSKIDFADINQKSFLKALKRWKENEFLSELWFDVLKKPPTIILGDYENFCPEVIFKHKGKFSYSSISIGKNHCIMDGFLNDSYKDCKFYKKIDKLMKKEGKPSFKCISNFQYLQDFTWVSLDEKAFYLTPTQAEVTKLFFEQHEMGIGAISINYVSGQLSDDKHKIKRLRDVFRSRLEAYKALFSCVGKGKYKLNVNFEKISH